MVHQKYIALATVIFSAAILLFACFVVVPSVTRPTCDELSTGRLDRNVSSIPVVSLKDDWMVSGDFFLGRGHIEEKSVYVFYTGNDEEGFSLQKLPVDNTKIFMDDPESPYLLTKNVLRCVRDATGMMMPTFTTKYEFHVPNGTIIKDYKLDGV